ncbi:MAG: N-acetylglucosamine-6-phosphate deacetylase, partial [Corynebacterium casei]|nr:N-acetylglucosamine-6-phosphate deacetylase [Corynebacterium casei]
MTVQPPSSTPAELFTGDISGLFYDGETTPRPATVTVRDGVIANIADDGDKGSAESWDGPVIVPGFIDLHNHGGAGGGFPTGTV